MKWFNINRFSAGSNARVTSASAYGSLFETNTVGIN